VNIPDAALVDFVGTFNSGASSNTGLTRGASVDASWHLLGNPYPSPLNWDLVDNAPATSLPGMDNAMYVFQSTGQYTGTYRSYVNGVGASPLIDAGSGYFVRVAVAGTPGSVNLTDAHRVTTFGPQPAFGRSNDVRPLLTLNLSGNGQQDETTVYFEAGATAGHDSQFDAVTFPPQRPLTIRQRSSNAIQRPSTARQRPSFRRQRPPLSCQRPPFARQRVRAIANAQPTRTTVNRPVQRPTGLYNGQPTDTTSTVAITRVAVVSSP
jgi:hypothetical protein